MKNSNDYLNPTNSVRFQATSNKQQAINETVPYNDIEEATSNKQPKPQATSIKHQAKKASSRKLQATSNKRPDF